MKNVIEPMSPMIKQCITVSRSFVKESICRLLVRLLGLKPIPYTAWEVLGEGGRDHESFNRSRQEESL
jgi:hypothetical protein